MKKQLIGAVVASMVVVGTIGATTLLQYTNYETENTRVLTTYSNKDEPVTVQKGGKGSIQQTPREGAINPLGASIMFSWESYTIWNDGLMEINNFTGDSFSGFYHYEDYFDNSLYSEWNGGFYKNISDLEDSNYLKINDKNSNKSFEIQQLSYGDPFDVAFNIGDLPLVGETKSFEIYADYTDMDLKGPIENTTSGEWGAGDFLYTFNFSNTSDKAGEDLYSLEIIETFISEDFENNGFPPYAIAGIVIGSLVIIGLIAGGGYYFYTTKKIKIS